MQRRILSVLMLLLLMMSPACAQESAIGVQALTPIACDAVADSALLPLYCGPTQGFYRHAGQALDLTQPYVFFGQHDCWAMAAQGTPEAFGPIGWVEAALLPALPDAPELAFEDSLAAMVEETALLTDNPVNADAAAWDIFLERGEIVAILAQLGDWLYVQTTIDGVPARVFLPASAIL